VQQDKTGNMHAAGKNGIMHAARKNIHFVTSRSFGYEFVALSKAASLPIENGLRKIRIVSKTTC